MQIPFQLVAAVDIETRRRHMLSAIQRGLPRLEMLPIREDSSLSLACYGPSLRNTWQDLRPPILSMSGATKWLAEHGITADYHIDMDPRANKVQDIFPPVPGVHYLMASVCAPTVFDALTGERVTIWHTVSSTEQEDSVWLSQHDFNSFLISGGSHVGQAAFHIGALLGYRHFEVHGMDGSYADDGHRHAGYHSGKPYPSNQTWAAGGKVYQTNKIMANGVAEVVNACRLYPMFTVFHGTGLQQALIAEANVPNACLSADTEKASRVRRARPQFIGCAGAPLKTASSVWEAICYANPDPAWVGELQQAIAWAETRRMFAKYNTGSVPLETMLLLRALCNWRRPRIVVEVGTFIGNSTIALQASERLYTCDRDNDCFPATDRIVTHPYMTSAQMFARLISQGVRADLVFLDGRLTDADVPLLLSLMQADTVLAFDDYHEGGKGMANIDRLKAHLPRHGFVGPYPMFTGRSTLALLVPMRSAHSVAA